MNHGCNYNEDPDIDTCSCSTNIKVPTREIDSVSFSMINDIYEKYKIRKSKYIPINSSKLN